MHSAGNGTPELKTRISPQERNVDGAKSVHRIESDGTEAESRDSQTGLYNANSSGSGSGGGGGGGTWRWPRRLSSVQVSEPKPGTRLPAFPPPERPPDLLQIPPHLALTGRVPHECRPAQHRGNKEPPPIHSWFRGARVLEVLTDAARRGPAHRRLLWVHLHKQNSSSCIVTEIRNPGAGREQRRHFRGEPGHSLADRRLRIPGVRFARSHLPNAPTRVCIWFGRKRATAEMLERPVSRAPCFQNTLESTLPGIRRHAASGGGLKGFPSNFSGGF